MMTTVAAASPSSPSFNKDPSYSHQLSDALAKRRPAWPRHAFDAAAPLYMCSTALQGYCRLDGRLTWQMDTCSCTAWEYRSRQLPI